SVTINKHDTATTVTLSPGTVGTGQTETLTAVINTGGLFGNDPGIVPTGTAAFWDGPIGSGTLLGTVPVSQVIVNQNGLPVITFQAALSTTFAVTGGHTINVRYSGDANFNTSDGSNTLQVVPATTTTVTSDNANPGSNNQTLNLTATVTPTSGTATGSVQFYDGSVPIGSPVNLNGSGVATL